MSKTKRRSKKKSGTKKNKERKYYPNSLIGKGSYKSVYDLISETNKHEIRDDSLTMEEREAMSVNIKGKKHKNIVLITPNKKIITEEDIKNFNNEFALQKNFAKKKLAPSVLDKKIKKFNGLDKLFALTYRCNFNICDYDYKKIENKLKKLFDQVSKEGYIYTDIKKGNLCEFNLLQKHKSKTNHFVFVDFDEKFVYKYAGFDTSGMKIPKEEIVSDIMEFMFLTIELYLCGNNLNCKFCKNMENIKNKINKIIIKYENEKLPMISNKKIKTLLHLTGVKIPLIYVEKIRQYVPFMNPLQVNNYYLSNTKDTYNNIKLYYNVQNLLVSDESPSNSASTKSSELGQLIIKPSPSTKSSEWGQLIIKPSPSTKSSELGQLIIEESPLSSDILSPPILLNISNLNRFNRKAIE